jgi:hypothetical protein
MTETMMTEVTQRRHSWKGKGKDNFALGLSERGVQEAIALGKYRRLQEQVVADDPSLPCDSGPLRSVTTSDVDRAIATGYGMLAAFEGRRDQDIVYALLSCKDPQLLVDSLEGLHVDVRLHYTDPEGIFAHYRSKDITVDQAVLECYELVYKDTSAHSAPGDAFVVRRDVANYLTVLLEILGLDDGHAHELVGHQPVTGAVQRMLLGAYCHNSGLVHLDPLEGTTFKRPRADEAIQGQASLSFDYVNKGNRGHGLVSLARINAFVAQYAA